MQVQFNPDSNGIASKSSISDTIASRSYTSAQSDGLASKSYTSAQSLEWQSNDSRLAIDSSMEALTGPKRPRTHTDGLGTKSTQTTVTMKSAEVASIVSGALDIDDPSVLRGTVLSTILRHGGAILADNKGSAATYNLSAPVEYLDVFISHNWCVPRLKKSLALAVCFNWQAAFLVSLCFYCCCFILTVAGHFPILRTQLVIGVTSIGASMTVPLFMIVLLFKPALYRCLGIYETSCFLDKTCIHQTDPERKQAGISKLGAFICKSTKMYVVYSDIYLRKLWTIYEVACFLTLRGWRDMKVVDVSLAMFSVVCMCIGYAFAHLRFTIPTRANKIEVEHTLSMLALCYIVRHANKVLKQLQQRIRDFDVQQALCFNEADRPLVETNIKVFMMHKGHISRNTRRKDAMNAFNYLVREYVGQAMRASLGKYGLPMSHILSMACLCNLVFQLDEVAAACGDGLWSFWSVHTLCGIAVFLTGNLAIFPIGLILTTRLLNCFMELSGVREAAWVVFCATFLLTSCGSLLLLNYDVLYGRAKLAGTFLQNDQQVHRDIVFFFIFNGGFWLAAAIILCPCTRRTATKALIKPIKGAIAATGSDMRQKTSAMTTLGGGLRRSHNSPSESQSTAGGSRSVLGSRSELDIDVGSVRVHFDSEAKDTFADASWTSSRPAYSRAGSRTAGVAFDLDVQVIPIDMMRSDDTDPVEDADCDLPVGTGKLSGLDVEAISLVTTPTGNKWDGAAWHLPPSPRREIFEGTMLGGGAPRVTRPGGATAGYVLEAELLQGLEEASGTNSLEPSVESFKAKTIGLCGVACCSPVAKQTQLRRQADHELRSDITSCLTVCRD